MTNVLMQSDTQMVAVDGMTELVRGTDARLVATVAPLVRTGSVALDLRNVHRIDAAGIAALISLYGCGREAGHTFRVYNASARVREILTLVGLDHILMSQDVVWPSHAGPFSACSAA